MNREDRLALFNCLKEPLNSSNLRTTFLLLTRAHYSDPKNYGYLQDLLKCVVWSKEHLPGTIEIEDTYNYDSNRDNRRPGIYVGADQPAKFSKIDLQSKQIVLDDNSGHDTGHIFQTGVNFIHVFESADQALLAADCTSSFFIGIKEMLQERLGLVSFEPLSVSPPAIIEKAPERFFRVDVIFGLSFIYNVRVNIESHRLKKFAIEFVGQES